ncbi:hypothetical protein Tco_0909133 [Tanacetum coccineum]|uniref:Uncharacterized protein n=1 Tax=Tanacetum coccineum TaxID=301880 RepID=A0ABQ5CSG1_9ASTR
MGWSVISLHWRRLVKECDKAPIVIEKDNPKVKPAVVKEKRLMLRDLRKTKPDVVKASVAKAKADVVKAPVAKDNHIGFKMNYMEGKN